MKIFNLGALVLTISLVAAQQARAFGPDGHRIAGLVAEAYLCAAASVEIGRLGQGDDLAELGLWADRIRTLPPWENSGSWHYLNIADDESLNDYQSPPEGDVLWAITHFHSRLGDESLSAARRAEALKFLVHFVVDLHQPLHVGRRVDRGGTSTDVYLGEERLSLHRFWDTDAIREDELPATRYARGVMSAAALLANEQRPSPARQWAAESLSLRGVVYDFDLETGQLDDDYLETASAVTQRRLIQAGLRLADQLNEALCVTRSAGLPAAREQPPGAPAGRPRSSR